MRRMKGERGWKCDCTIGLRLDERRGRKKKREMKEREKRREERREKRGEEKRRRKLNWEKKSEYQIEGTCIIRYPLKNLFSLRERERERKKERDKLFFSAKR